MKISLNRENRILLALSLVWILYVCIDALFVNLKVKDYIAHNFVTVVSAMFGILIAMLFVGLLNFFIERISLRKRKNLLLLFLILPIVSVVGWFMHDALFSCTKSISEALTFKCLRPPAEYYPSAEPNGPIWKILPTEYILYFTILYILFFILAEQMLCLMCFGMLRVFAPMKKSS